MSVTRTMKRVLLASALTLSFTAVSFAAYGQDVKKGEAVYTAQKCSLCHQIAGKGNKASPLDGVGAKLSADDIRQWITHPTEAAAKAKSTKKPPMPNRYSKLPPADIDSLVAYLASLK